MDNSMKKYASNILYSEDIQNACDAIMNIIDSDLLHVIAINYNWDDGFEVPNSIINNEYCSLSTALILFFDAEGELLLENKEVLKNSDMKEWVDFVSKLEKMIIDNRFQHRNIKYVPPLSKVQIFKLKKCYSTSNIFFEIVDGKSIDVKV